MKKIKLYSKTYGNKYVYIDDDDYKLVSLFNWSIAKGLNTFYAVYTIELNVKVTISMHRLLMNSKDNQIVDHINMNGLDNRRGNLRFTTKSKNALNSLKHKDNSSGYKGIDLDKRRNKWRARKRINGKNIWIGEFKNKQDAINAYRKVEDELY